MKQQAAKSSKTTGGIPSTQTGARIAGRSARIAEKAESPFRPVFANCQQVSAERNQRWTSKRASLNVTNGNRHSRLRRATSKRRWPSPKCYPVNMVEDFIGNPGNILVAVQWGMEARSAADAGDTGFPTIIAVSGRRFGATLKSSGDLRTVIEASWSSGDVPRQGPATSRLVGI